MTSIHFQISILALLIHGLNAFSLLQPFSTSTTATTSLRPNTNILSSLDASPASSATTTVETNPNAKPSDEWELDCYSRPVMVGGKKLWEVLITDSTGSFRRCETLPSNK